MEAEQALTGAGELEESAHRAAEGVSQERAEADRLQREAGAREARAETLERVAQRESERADEQRAAGEEAARRAEEVDPFSPDPDDDFDADRALASRRGGGVPGGIEPASQNARNERQDDDVDDEERPGSTRV